MTLRIYIPSLGRPGQKQITLRQMPDKVRKMTTLVLARSEIGDHKSWADQGVKLVDSPQQGRGIGPVRDWIIRHAMLQGHRYIMMLDDDLTFQRRGADGIRNSTPEQYLEALEWIEDTLRGEKIAACGLGVRFLQWKEKVKEYAEPARMMQSLAYDLNVLRKTGARFMKGFAGMDFALMTDFNMTLQLLKAGYTNRVSLLHRITPRAANQPGGCATWRTADLQSASAERLQKLHTDVVTLREKKGWEGMDASMWDVNVQWKKALLLGLGARGDN